LPALGAPSAHQVVTFLELGHQARDIGGIVFAIAIERDDDITAGIRKAALQGRGLPRCSSRV